MRSILEQKKLIELQRLSLIGPQDWTNNKGERFIYEDGEFVAYTNTKVIDHEGMHLVNIAEFPLYD